MSNLSKPDRNFWTTIILIVIGGLFAGVLGSILTQVYIFPSFSYSASELNLANLNNNNLGLVIRNPQKVIVNQDVKVSETISSIRPSLVGIFKTISSSSTKQTSAVLNNNSHSKINSQSSATYYRLDHPLFTGLIITADGWVLALAPSNLAGNFKFKNYTVIGNNRHSYQIDRFIYLQKSPGALMLLHLQGAANLPTKKIVARSDLSLGQSLLIFQGMATIQPSVLTSLVRKSLVSNSDVLSANLNLTNGDNSKFKNSFVFNLAGDLVAIINSQQKIIPAFSYQTIWSSLVQNTPATKPFLGVNYLNLSLIKALGIKLSQGAWLHSGTQGPAVLKNSPAAVAGLRAGDIITWVNNQKIDSRHDLADLLSNYKAGETITLTYNRQGREKTAEIKLGKLK